MSIIAWEADGVDKASLIERIHSWRRILARDIYVMSGGAARIEEISRAVQRFLCRTIISQMLTSRGILDTGHWMPDARYSMLESSVQFPVSSIQKVQEEIAGMDLGEFPFEVLSDIYESYLTRKLVLNNSTGEFEYLPEGGLRKGRGIYYTPWYIVRYIVDRTLGKYLWGTESGRPNEGAHASVIRHDSKIPPSPFSKGGEPAGTMPARTPEDIRDLRILDPACGSGSFLSYAFDVLAEFYALHDPRNETDWPSTILENHLYGIDLDSDAVDITSAILTLRALERKERQRQRGRCVGELVGEWVSGETHSLTHSPSIPYALCPNVRQGNFLISGPSAPPDLKPFNRETEMPEVLGGGGFTMILGNPPYGAQLTKAERKLIRLDYETHRSSDSSSLFVEKAVKMLGDDGILGFIVPKSLSYVVSWYPIRQFLLNECRIVGIADASEAFRDVLLEEMVIIAQKRGEPDARTVQIPPCPPLLKGGERGLPLVKGGEGGFPFSKGGTSVSILRPEYSVVSHSIDSTALSAKRFSIWLSSRRIRNIVDRIWEKSVPLGHLAEIWSGLNIQKLPVFSDAPDSEHNHSCLRGKDIQRYHIRQGIQYIKITDAVKRQRPSLETFCRPKIIAQDIVAHIQNPRPHIKLTATIDRSKNWLNVNTVTNITSSEYHLEYLCGVLNSRLTSWYAYDFIYNRAIRTMHFRRGYADHIPIRRIEPSDPCGKLMYKQLVECVNRMIDLYDEGTIAEDEIAELDGKIDELIYQLYGITEEDVRFLEEHAGLYN